MKKLLFVLIVVSCKLNAQNPQRTAPKKEAGLTTVPGSVYQGSDKTPDASTYSNATPLVGQKSLVPVAAAPLTTVSIAPPDTSSSSSTKKPNQNK